MCSCWVRRLFKFVKFLKLSWVKLIFSMIQVGFNAGDGSSISQSMHHVPLTLYTLINIQMLKFRENLHLGLIQVTSVTAVAIQKVDFMILLKHFRIN